MYSLIELKDKQEEDRRRPKTDQENNNNAAIRKVIYVEYCNYYKKNEIEEYLCVKNEF
jgi:hypothetical protein